MKDNFNRIATFSSVVVILASLAISWYVLSSGADWFVYLLGIFNLIAGPACFIAYVREIRKGVFRDDD